MDGGKKSWMDGWKEIHDHMNGIENGWMDDGKKNS